MNDESINFVPKNLSKSLTSNPKTSDNFPKSNFEVKKIDKEKAKEYKNSSSTHRRKKSDSNINLDSKIFVVNEDIENEEKFVNQNINEPPKLIKSQDTIKIK